MAKQKKKTNAKKKSAALKQVVAASDKHMLHAHLENSESYLIEISNVPSISGHSLHKGTPREVFVREFLAEHLPLDLAIGTGELIDSRTVAGGKRNQHDIVIYKRSFPRIHMGGNINAFLCESVLATIEIKSVLDASEVLKAAQAAHEAKKLQPSGNAFPYGQPHPFQAPGIPNYVLAYRGPAKMETVFGWIAEAYNKLGVKDPEILDGTNRMTIASAALDGVFVLGTGACIFENNAGFLHNPLRAEHHGKATWTVMDSKRGALPLLFSALMGLF